MTITLEMASEIAHVMVNPPIQNGRNNFNGQSSVPAGLTYIGQLISHDIVEPTSKNINSRTVTPALNLDSIYGSAPLYQFKAQPGKTGFLNDKGKFDFDNDQMKDFVREKVNVASIKSGAVTEQYIPNIPELRNDENVIVAQLHLLLQRLHNKIVDDYKVDALEARRMVTLLFQLVVIEDFLQKISTKNVYKQIFHCNRTFLDWKKGTIPNFFSKASFRFGHSIVRNSYRLRPKESKTKLCNLFKRNQKIPPELEIDWEEFFTKKQKAANFDTKISAPMDAIPPAQIDGIAVRIIYQNLKAAIETKLISGAEFLTRLNNQTNYQDIKNSLTLKPVKSLKRASFKNVSGLTTHNLPLWLYVLLEAQQQKNSKRLGTLGSLLNAEVLKWSIEQAEFSVYRNGQYDFKCVMESLGKLGQDIERVRNQRPIRKKSKLTMMAVIDFLTQQGTQNEQ